MLPEQQQRIMGYFIEEAKDHLNTIEQGLLSLQSTIEDPERANEVFRAAHSVKGGAAMLGLESIQKTAHRMEDYFKILKESPVAVDRTLETMFLRISDGLKDLLEQLEGPFGLTQDKAQEIMADVDPVFERIESHLNSLVEKAGGTANGIQTTGAVDTNTPEALKASFKKEVGALLRQMLGTFKQSDTPETRQTIQEICNQFLAIGKQFELSEWCDLIETARLTSKSLDNDYRSLAPVLIKEIKKSQDLVLSGRASEVAVSEAMQALLPEDILADPQSSEVNGLLELDLESGLEDSLEGLDEGDLDWDEVEAAEESEGLDDLFSGDLFSGDLFSGDPESLESVQNEAEDNAELIEGSSLDASDSSSVVIDDTESADDADNDGNTNDFDGLFGDEIKDLESSAEAEEAAPIDRLSVDLEFDEIPSELSTLNRSAQSQEKADESLDALLATVNVTGPDVGTEELNSLADLFSGDLDELDNTLGGHAFVSEEMQMHPERIDMSSEDDLTDLLAENATAEAPVETDSEAEVDDDLFGGTLTEGEFAIADDLDSTDYNTNDHSDFSLDSTINEAAKTNFDDIEVISETSHLEAPVDLTADIAALSEDLWAEEDNSSESDLFGESVDALLETPVPESDDVAVVSANEKSERTDLTGIQNELDFDAPFDTPDDLSFASSDLDALDLEASLDDLDFGDLSLDDLDSHTDALEVFDSVSESVEDERGFNKDASSAETKPTATQKVSPREPDIDFPTLTGAKLQEAEEDIDSFFLDIDSDEPESTSEENVEKLVFDDDELAATVPDAVPIGKQLDDDPWGELAVESTLTGVGDRSVESTVNEQMSGLDWPMDESSSDSPNKDKSTEDESTEAKLDLENTFLDLEADAPFDADLDVEQAGSELDELLEVAVVEESEASTEASSDGAADDELWDELVSISNSNPIEEGAESADLASALLTEDEKSAPDVLDYDLELPDELETSERAEEQDFESSVFDDSRAEPAIASTDNEDDLFDNDFDSLDISVNDVSEQDLFEKNSSEDAEDDLFENDLFEDKIFEESFSENDLTLEGNSSDISNDELSSNDLSGDELSDEILADFETAFGTQSSEEAVILENDVLDTIDSSDNKDTAEASLAAADASDALDINDLEIDGLLDFDELENELDNTSEADLNNTDENSLKNSFDSEDFTLELGSDLDNELDGFLTDDELSAMEDEPPQVELTPTVSDEASDFGDLDSLLAEEDEYTAVGTANDMPTFVGAIAPSPAAVEADDEEEDFGDLERLLEDGPAEGATASAPRRTPQKTAQRRSGSAVREQNMRVSVSHLDTLSNLVGELVVSRNTLERDQERLRQFLDNLLFQVQQLNDVGQRMRDLYERSLLESSLVSNRRTHSAENQPAAEPTTLEDHATGEVFDALEMDRFTGFHTLSQEMIELIVRVRESSSDIGYTVESSDQVTRQFRQITTQLQEGLNTARMVAFSQAADRLPRAVRDISLKCGKEARLIVEGQDTLIDKMIVEHLYDPLTHLVNNAITHGIETPEARKKAGKLPEGSITVRAFYQGNQTVIYVADDGGGINTEFVKKKAVEKKLISQNEAEDLSDLDTYELLFHPGFSTRDQADDFAGRGVGMDVVRTSLAEIRGSVTIDSEMGKGTSFTIRLPLTLSISKALSCVSNQARIAFPMDGVEDMLDVPRDRIVKNDQDQDCVRWRDTLLTFQPVTELLKFNRTLGRGRVYGGGQDDDVLSIIVLRSANTYIAVQVDQVIGEQEIVIKQLEGPVPKPLGIAGATVLGDGRVMPIADVLELIDIAMGRIRRDSASMTWAKDAQAAEEAPVKNDPTVLIVDDSITVRELLSMSFNKVGYRVEQARDGQEAWDQLRSGLPCDLVFCDIEMPRMDGLELLSRMQKDNHLKNVPIAMLTSRGADRHRQMAVDLGASGYFTKPYLEEALLDAAQRMLNGETLAKGRGG